jgi:YesN/AraC family two-component response regulator
MMENVEGATTYERQISTSDIMEIIPIDYQNEKPIDSNREKQFSLVIVEDNKDLLNLLSKKLREKYAVKSFENGLDAWNYIQEKTPDVVITDVMMPVMSGIELCEKIKTNIDLCHIPVVMLTAKTTNEAKMEGLQVGADMYIPKPFSIEELELRLNNILKVRIALKNKLAELSKIEGFNIPSSNKEQAFIEKVFALIHENIHESDLDVQLLADKLNISRTNLHNRIKNTMNMSTTEFINTIRINKAKELMLETYLTFSEISYKVGYNDSAYFSRMFKKVTGETPGEFRKNK